MGGQPGRLQAAFNALELGPRLHERFEIKYFKTGLAIARNIEALPQGGFSVRPGLRHVGEVQDDATRLIDFRAADGSVFDLVFGAASAQVWGETAMSDSFTHPYTAAQCRVLDWAQQLDTLAADAAPLTLDDFAAERLARPDARIVAGATDVALWVNKQFRDIGEPLWIGRVAELRRIEVTGDALHIGAAASLEDAWRTLADMVPTLREVWQRFASPPIRHAGTMGGNIANGSPIGDSAPVLIALGADIVLRRGAVERTMPLQAFYLDYMKNALQPGEFVARLIVPKPTEGTQVRAWKISKRYDSDISAVCAAFALRLDGDRVAEVRLAFGGMAAIVKRAAQTEAVLLGQPWTEATLVAAQAALAQDFRPLSDLRASAAYRLKVSANLLRRLWLETRPDDPLPPEDTTVWTPRLTIPVHPETRA